MSSEHKTELMQIVIRKPCGFKKQFNMLSRAWNLQSDQKASIKDLFHPSPKSVTVLDSEHLTESSFSFWGFVDKSKSLALLKFLFLCVRPRSHLSSETSPGRFEVFMTINLRDLSITRSAFEVWLQCLLDTLKFSAGCLFFPKYMNDQMYGCLERIFRGQNLMTNLWSLWNKDLRVLYQHMRASKIEAQCVLDRTGLVFNTDTFIHLYLENQILKKQLTENDARTNPTLGLHAAYGTITILTRLDT
jgi:hypothetical protein